METIQDFLISNRNPLLEITLQSYPHNNYYITLLILSIHTIVQTVLVRSTMYTHNGIETQNINWCTNSDYHLWFLDMNSCNSSVFTVYVPITSCHISYMPIHTTWFYAFLLLHSTPLQQLVQYSGFSNLNCMPFSLSIVLFSEAVVLSITNHYQLYCSYLA